MKHSGIGRSFIVAGLALALAACSLAGCSSGPSRNAALYESQLKAQRQAQQERADQFAKQQAQLLATANTCTEDVCRVAISGFLGMALQSAGTAHDAPLPAPPYERDKGAQARDFFTGMATFVVPGLQAAVSWHQSDVARDTNRDQTHYLETVIGGAVNAARDVGIAAQNSAPRVTVGGDYVTGTQIGGDSIGGDRTETTVGRDQVGGDQIQGSHLGDGDRYNSPSPCSAGNGAAGGTGGNGGTGGTTAGGAGAAGGNGAPGGDCSQGGG